MSVTVRQIRAFDAAATTGSFTDAAEQLHLTQSAVSMLIRQMETILGLAVFIRSGTGVQLTEFGEAIRPSLTRALIEISDVSKAAQGIRNLKRGQLRLALPHVLASTWLPSIIHDFRANHPDISIDVTDTIADRIIDTVVSGVAEVGIGPARALPANVTAIALWDVPILMARPQYVEAGAAVNLTSEGEEKLSWIHYSDEFNARLQDVRSDAAHPQHSDIRVRGLLAALSLLQTGPHVTTAPSYAAEYANVFNVKLDALAGDPVVQRFSFYHRKGRPLTPPATLLLKTALATSPAGATLCCAETS
jgi:DNA-binding transcriptional LysR family regulator